MSKILGKDAQIRSDLLNSVKDGCCYSVMVGMGESYLAAFILALGFSALSSALVTTLPLLAGALLQLASPHGVKKFRSYSKWVVLAARIQALSFFVFVAAAITRIFPEWALYVTASIYWGASMATGPAWNAWISALVPQKIRTDYFTKRSRLAYVSTLLGLLAGGLILEYGRRLEMEMSSFILIFSASALLRFLSAHYLSRQSEPRGMVEHIRLLSFAETFRRIMKNPYGKILIYLFFLQIAVQAAAGFFTPFMLSQLKLPYWSYMILASTIVLSKAIAMPFVLRFIKRFGLRKALVAASIGISPLPIGWLLSDNFYYLICLQFLAGFIWSAHELVTFLILFGEIPEKERTSVLTEFNLFNTIGVIIGAIIGGVIFNNLGQNYNAYFTIFFVSTTLRFACVGLIPEVARPLKNLRIYFRAVGARPATGMISRPIITDLDEE